MGVHAALVPLRLLEAGIHDPRLSRHPAPEVGSAQGRIVDIGRGTFQQALAESRRVLHPSGRFLPLEHGQSPDSRIRALLEHARFAIDPKLVSGRYVARLPHVVGWSVSGTPPR